jgi:hypothetical protein
MGNKFLLFIITAVAFTSCTTAYKTGQTPDDVYYSPRRVYDESKERRQDDDRTARRDDDAEERRIRRSINDRRWRWLDDDITFNTGYNPWSFGYGYGYYYNPFYCNTPVYNVVNVVKLSNPKVFTPRTTSLASYNNTRNYNNSNNNGNSKFGLGNSNARARGSYNNSNSGGSRLGSVLGKIFNGATQGINNGNNSSGNRSYSPSSSGGKSGGSSGGSVRPARNGRG